jgi:hypothetical protein
MIEQIAGKWKGFTQLVTNWLSTMDADPLEDIHHRLRRLEAASLQSEAGRRGSTEADCPANQG